MLIVVKFFDFSNILKLMFFLFLAVFKGHMVFKKLRETCNFDLAKFGPNPRSWGRVMFKKLKKLTTIKATTIKV